LLFRRAIEIDRRGRSKKGRVKIRMLQGREGVGGGRDNLKISRLRGRNQSTGGEKSSEEAWCRTKKSEEKCNQQKLFPKENPQKGSASRRIRGIRPSN